MGLKKNMVLLHKLTIKWTYRCCFEYSVKYLKKLKQFIHLPETQSTAFQNLPKTVSILILYAITNLVKYFVPSY